MSSLKKNLDLRKSPLLRDLPEVPRRKSKETKMNVITKPAFKVNDKSPCLIRSPKSPVKTPLKSPGSSLRDITKIFKKSNISAKKEDDEDNDLKTEELGTNYVMEEKEINILKFLEEENIVMANPKEKQFEYFENVKKNAFLIFSAVDRSRSEGKRFSLDSSTLLNKRRSSLPRLQKDNESSNASENESSSPDGITGPKSLQGESRNLNIGFLKLSSEKKSKFNVNRVVDRHFASASPIQKESDRIRTTLREEEKERSDYPNSSSSSQKGSDGSSDDESNISSEEKS